MYTERLYKEILRAVTCAIELKMFTFQIMFQNKVIFKCNKQI